MTIEARLPSPAAELMNVTVQPTSGARRLAGWGR
jgi:hypothetical protein